MNDSQFLYLKKLYVEEFPKKTLSQSYHEHCMLLNYSSPYLQTCQLSS